jgi:O-antigen/teichoic acid export membrane protein
MLVGGTASAQILLVLVSPILTRLYSPQDFGLLAVYASLLALINVVSSLRYGLAIPLPEYAEDAAHVVILCLILIVFSGLLTGVLILLFGDSIAKKLGVPILSDHLWLLPLGVLFAGAYTVFNYWGVRTKRFASIAATKLWQGIVTIVVQLTFYKLGSIALLVGQVAGHGMGTTRLAAPAIATGEFKRVTWRGVLSAASRYRRFPIYSTWEGFGSKAGVELPPILFASLFGPGAAGLYALSNRVLQLPVSLVGTAVGQVFFAEAAEARRTGKIGSLVDKMHNILAHIGMGPSLILIVVAPDLFTVVFGADWREAGEFARWMTPWLYLVFVSSPLSTLFAVFEKQNQALVFQSILLASRVSALVIGAMIGDLMCTVMLFSAVSAVCWLGFLFWIAHIAGNSLLSILRPNLSAMGIAVLCASPVILIHFVSPGVSIWWLVAILSSAALVAVRYWHLLRKVY